MISHIFKVSKRLSRLAARCISIKSSNYFFMMLTLTRGLQLTEYFARKN